MAKAPKSDQKRRKTQIIVPVDASGIEDRTGLSELKVLLVASNGDARSVSVKLDRGGKGEARFDATEAASARVIVGPPDASDEELQGLQTLAVDIPYRTLTAGDLVRIDPVIVHPSFWHWWLRWCRTFTIRGRLTCPDGSPVPGAEVCAYDVGRFWWWCSRQQVGCAVTDANGAFTITFRWCCGWWPWWWWRRRHWQIDPRLLGQINELIPRPPEPPVDLPGIGGATPVPPPGPRPDPVPDMTVLQQVIGEEAGITTPEARITDPGQLEALRPALLKALPASAELQALRIWPWAPWHPWADCTPDIIFRATQDCGEGEVVILDEDCGDARWNIPTTLDVALVSNDKACCIRPRPPVCEEDGCIVLSHICDDLVANIGGNVNAPSTPEGYRSPSPATPLSWVYSYDRPYGGRVPVKGVCTDWIDYYGFEYSGDGGTTWAPLPPGTTGGVRRTYFDPGTLTFQHVMFNFSSVDGEWVAESLGHWESVNGPRIWVGDFHRLINWDTDALIPDGVYRLRLRAYSEAGGKLTDEGIPTLCGSQDENFVVVAIDNRITGPGSGHPTSPSHPVPPGGVHFETLEPDTDFISIRVGTTTIGPCGTIDRSLITPANPLVIDFLVSDPDGHLALYTLRANWGENNGLNLLAAGTLSKVAADFIGPTYGTALLQGATPPSWKGGHLQLTITNGNAAFPQPCAYLLDLRAYKRNIVSCDDHYTYRNRSTMTLSVV